MFKKTMSFTYLVALCMLLLHTSNCKSRSSAAKTKSPEISEDTLDICQTLQTGYERKSLAEKQEVSFEDFVGVYLQAMETYVDHLQEARITIESGVDSSLESSSDSEFKEVYRGLASMSAAEKVEAEDILNQLANGAMFKMSDAENCLAPNDIVQQEFNLIAPIRRIPRTVRGPVSIRKIANPNPDINRFIEFTSVADSNLSRKIPPASQVLFGRILNDLARLVQLRSRNQAESLFTDSADQLNVSHFRFLRIAAGIIRGPRSADGTYPIIVDVGEVKYNTSEQLPAALQTMLQTRVAVNMVRLTSPYNKDRPITEHETSLDMQTMTFRVRMTSSNTLSISDGDILPYYVSPNIVRRLSRNDGEFASNVEGATHEQAAQARFSNFAKVVRAKAAVNAAIKQSRLQTYLFFGINNALVGVFGYLLQHVLGSDGITAGQFWSGWGISAGLMANLPILRELYNLRVLEQNNNIP